VQIGPAPAVPDAPPEEFDAWMDNNLVDQQQEGFATIWIKLITGDISTKQMIGLADLLEKHQLTGVRVAVNQNLVMPWVLASRVQAIYAGLKALDLAMPGARTIADVTGCPGATTCNLGITRSLTLAGVLSREFAGETDPAIRKIRIKISGCPNSCGQHHIADIGFYGNARKIGEQQAPFYQLMLGGKADGDGVAFGRQVLPLPARRIPQVIRELLDFYKSSRLEDESFREWADRTPDKDIISRLRPIADAADSKDELFVDWGDTETYSLKLGRGECAA